MVDSLAAWGSTRRRDCLPMGIAWSAGAWSRERGGAGRPPPRTYLQTALWFVPGYLLHGCILRWLPAIGAGAVLLFTEGVIGPRDQFNQSLDVGCPGGEGDRFRPLCQAGAKGCRERRDDLPIELQQLFENGARHDWLSYRLGGYFGSARCNDLRELLAQHLAGLLAVLPDDLRRGRRCDCAGADQLLHIGIRVAHDQYLIDVLPGFPHLLGDLFDGPSERNEPFVAVCELQRGELAPLLGSDHAEHALSVVTAERNDGHPKLAVRVAWQPALGVELEVGAPAAVPVDNPHAAVFARPHFKGRNDAALVQVVGQIRDALFEVFALGAEVETGLFVKVFEASLHRIRALQVAVLDHLLERFGRHEASVCCDCVMLYGGVVWPVSISGVRRFLGGIELAYSLEPSS
ncbi:hypothetical protein PA1R_gp1508 [Pseudomonas aeruginosa PA1R]|nr:hypothetical protein PA1R_gp1508 [Pseudomonas aeruginosa PA1R]